MAIVIHNLDFIDRCDNVVAQVLNYGTYKTARFEYAVCLIRFYLIGTCL